MTKRVITFGVFDIFHLGHLNMLQNAKLLGDSLIVAVHDDIYKTKGVEFFYSLEDRMKFINALKCVDEVISYVAVDDTLAKVHFDVFAHGPDQNHEKFERAKKFAIANEKEVVLLPRTEGISSSQLREYVNIDRPKILG